MVKLTDEEKVETKERTEKGVADEEKAETKEDAEKRLNDKEKEMMKAAIDKYVGKHLRVFDKVEQFESEGLIEGVTYGRHYNSPFDVELVVRYSDCHAAPISVNKILKGATKKHSYKVLD